MDHSGHRSLSTRKELLNRWLHPSYGGDGLVNKAAIIQMATREVDEHAQLVQFELNKQRHDRELESRKRSGLNSRRAAGKLRRLRGTLYGRVIEPI